MHEAKLSSKNQIVIPTAARRALGVRSGDRLLAVTRGNILILMRKPDDYARAIRGIARGLYGDGYVREEKDSW